MTDEQLAQEFFKGMMFERWVRFQFLEEREGEARIAIPADWLSHIALAEPELSALANALNGLPADLKNSQKGLAAFFSSTLAKAGRDAADINRILRNQLIWQANDQASDWLMMHEQTLPRLEFAKWLALFGEWQKNQPKS